MCKVYEEGFIPDENVGCSNTNNCQISEQGTCIKFLDNFILIGENTQNMAWCKSQNSEDFKNCEKIGQKIGKCEKCEQNYFLNKGDLRYTSIENSSQSSYGICVSIDIIITKLKFNTKCKQACFKNVIYLQVMKHVI